MSSNTLSLEAPDVQKKYSKLVLSGLLFLFLGLAFIGGSFAYLDAKGVYAEDSGSLMQVMPFIMIFIPIYGWRIFKDGLHEKKLYQKSASKTLNIGEKGIYGPIILLEGPVRNRLRDAHKPDFHVDWDDVDKFIIEPQRGKKYSSPPYYKVTIKDKKDAFESSYFIIREYFKGQEAEIIKCVEAHLGADNVINNDTENSLNGEV